MKKISLIFISIASLFLFSTNAFALSVSFGIPISHSINDSNIAESDGVSGYLLGVQLPFLVGLGIDSHETKLKDTNDIKLATDMYNIFYQLPIPIINLIVGLGIGNSMLECDNVGDGTTCSDSYKKGSATQWYTSIGMPIIPFFDIHLSYRSITSKNIVEKSNDTKLDLSGSVTGVGIAFNF